MAGSAQSRAVARLRTGPAADAGLSLIEVLVATTLIGLVMTSVATFFVRSVSVTDQQTGKQVAVQVADSAVETVRALKGSAVAEGRDPERARQQWDLPVAGVGPYLAGMRRYPLDVSEFQAGTVALPTEPVTVTVNGLDYRQHWYVGKCWQRTGVGGGDCGPTQGAGFVEFFKVVVAVTWPHTDCPADSCSFVTSTMVSSASAEATFNTNQTALPPKVTNPGNQPGPDPDDQPGQVDVAVSLQLAATGGAPPFTWGDGGSLPAGLELNPVTGLISGSPLVAGSYQVTVSATDVFDLTGSAVFTWVVSPPPQLASPGDQSSQGGEPLSVAVPRTGGTAPYTWSMTRPGSWGATGLPPGLALDPATGVISGTPTATGAAQVVRVNVVDKYAKPSTVSFTWAIPAVLAATPGQKSGEVRAPVTPVQLTAVGGIRPYTWTATGLPPGLSMSSSGVISGTPTTAGTYANVVATATDASTAKSSTAAFRWVVIPPPSITTEVAGRTDSVNTLIDIQQGVTGGTAPYTWSAANLPAGITMSAAGRLSGRLSGGSRFLTRVTVTDALGVTDSYTFTWNVGASGSVLRVTSPTTDRLDLVGLSPTVLLEAKGGSGFAETWTATGLPPGMVVNNSTERITGRLTTAGTYTVTLVVRDYYGTTATFMFIWRVQ